MKVKKKEKGKKGNDGERWRRRMRRMRREGKGVEGGGKHCGKSEENCNRQRVMTVIKKHVNSTAGLKMEIYKMISVL